MHLYLLDTNTCILSAAHSKYWFYGLAASKNKKNNQLFTITNK